MPMLLQMCKQVMLWHAEIAFPQLAGNDESIGCRNGDLVAECSDPRWTARACMPRPGGGRIARETLLPTIDRLFRETGLTLKHFDGLVVSIGPGSFTGLRVGLATILGFRTISQLPLAVVPTLEGMAWNLRGTSTLLCPILNSRRGELYWAMFRWTSGGRLERVVSEQVGTAAMLAHSLTGSALVFGEGWTMEESAIRAAIVSSVI